MTSDETEALIQAYFNAFKSYKDSEIREAADEYIKTGEYFPPKPVQILSLVRDAAIKKHDRELVEMWTCRICNEKVSCISNSRICADCQGYPLPSYESIQPWPDYTPNQYKIEGRVKCQKCGSIGTCIKEPINEGTWLCQDCYSQSTKKERIQRLKDLATMMGDKTFCPSWADWLVLDDKGKRIIRDEIPF